MPTLVKIVDVPDQNHLRWVRTDSPLAANKTLRPDDFFKYQQYFYDAKVNYLYPSTFNDWHVVQIQVGGLYAQTTAHAIEILDKFGKVLKTIGWESQGSMPGNFRTAGGVQYTMDTYNFGFSFSQYGINKPDTYYFRLKMSYWVDAVQYFEYTHMSEPIKLRAEHPYTDVIAYSSHTNRFGVQWRSPNVFMYARVYLKIEEHAMKNTTTSYKDQGNAQRQQNAIPYKQHIVKFGYPKGMPMYQYAKINQWMSNNDFFIAGVKYVIETDAELQIAKKDPRYKLYGATLLINEADETEATVNTTVAPLTVYTRTTAVPSTGAPLPYCVFKIILRSSNGNSIDVYTGFEVNTLQQENDWLIALNNHAKSAKGLRGYFKRDGNKIVYINGNGEYWDNSDSVIFTKRLIAVYQLNYATNPNMTIGLNMNLRMSRCCVVPKHNYEVYSFGNPTGAIYYNVNVPNYNYGFDQSANVSIWHDNTIMDFNITSYDFIEFFTPPFNGFYPTNTEVILFQNTRTTSFDFTSVPTTLKTFVINFTNLTDIFNFHIKSWNALTLVNVGGNKMNSAAVDSAFNQYETSPTAQPAGFVFYTKYQSPVAPPTGASATARGNIIANGGLYYTD